MSRKFILILLTLTVFAFGISLITTGTETKPEAPTKPVKSRQKEPSFVKELLSDFSMQYRLFKKATLENGRYTYNNGRYTVVFTVDPQFQQKVEAEFKRFKVKYGAFVAEEPYTGKIVAVVSSLEYPDMAMKRSYPTASTFKIVTAAAALDSGLATPKTELVCGGVGDSCSPSVWLNSPFKVKREFAQSFATSANPFFGNLGRLIGKEELLKYARLFGFNSKLYNFPWGIYREPLDGYELALMAAGLGDTTTSPFHQAVIAQTILNNGVMLKPTFIEKIIDNKTGKVVYTFKPEVIRRVVKPETAKEIERMMELTVKLGTVSRRRYFLQLRRRYPDAVIGGKTGTLTEKSYPEGRCEWFTGFLKVGDRTIALSSVAVNNWLYYISGYEIAAVAAMDFAKLYQNYAKLEGEPCASSAK
ncbi:penicillin-binding transpeptidase domain-containing protein [Thermovibrio ammonificans]